MVTFISTCAEPAVVTDTVSNQMKEYMGICSLLIKIHQLNVVVVVVVVPVVVCFCSF